MCAAPLERDSTRRREFAELPCPCWEESSPPIHILFTKVSGTWSKVYEDKKWSLKVVADINGDGFPEFYAPYSDSADGNLISIYSIGDPIDVGFSSGH